INFKKPWLKFSLCIFSFWSSKSDLIFKLSPVSDRKKNLIGTLEGQKKTRIFTQNQFKTKSINLFYCTKKIITTTKIFDFYENFLCVVLIVAKKKIKNR
ncbi:hypothetical protein FWK35_00030580, partial [Aphis craccivora]